MQAIIFINHPNRDGVELPVQVDSEAELNSLVTEISNFIKPQCGVSGQILEPAVAD
jgi:hypothetical protein